MFKNTSKRIAFENAYKSIIFQPFLYANVPAESPSYAPTFFTMSVKIYLLFIFNKILVIQRVIIEVYMYT